MSSAVNPLCCIVIPDITSIIFGSIYSSDSNPKSSKSISTSTTPPYQNSVSVETSSDDQSKRIIEAPIQPIKSIPLVSKNSNIHNCNLQGISRSSSGCHDDSRCSSHSNSNNIEPLDPSTTVPIVGTNLLPMRTSIFSRHPPVNGVIPNLSNNTQRRWCGASNNQQDKALDEEDNISNNTGKSFPHSYYSKNPSKKDEIESNQTESQPFLEDYDQRSDYHKHDLEMVMERKHSRLCSTCASTQHRKMNVRDPSLQATVQTRNVNNPSIMYISSDEDENDYESQNFTIPIHLSIGNTSPRLLPPYPYPQSHPPPLTSIAISHHSGVQRQHDSSTISDSCGATSTTDIGGTINRGRQRQRQPPRRKTLISPPPLVRITRLNQCQQLQPQDRTYNDADECSPMTATSSSSILTAPMYPSDATHSIATTSLTHRTILQEAYHNSDYSNQSLPYDERREYHNLKYHELYTPMNSQNHMVSAPLYEDTGGPAALPFPSNYQPPVLSTHSSYYPSATMKRRIECGPRDCEDTRYHHEQDKNRFYVERNALENHNCVAEAFHNNPAAPKHYDVSGLPLDVRHQKQNEKASVILPSSQQYPVDLPLHHTHMRVVVLRFSCSEIHQPQLPSRPINFTYPDLSARLVQTQQPASIYKVQLPYMYFPPQCFDNIVHCATKYNGEAGEDVSRIHTPSSLLLSSSPEIDNLYYSFDHKANEENNDLRPARQTTQRMEFSFKTNSISQAKSSRTKIIPLQCLPNGYILTHKITDFVVNIVQQLFQLRMAASSSVGLNINIVMVHDTCKAGIDPKMEVNETISLKKRPINMKVHSHDELCDVTVQIMLTPTRPPGTQKQDLSSSDSASRSTVGKGVLASDMRQGSDGSVNSRHEQQRDATPLEQNMQQGEMIIYPGYLLPSTALPGNEHEHHQLYRDNKSYDIRQVPSNISSNGSATMRSWSNVDFRDWTNVFLVYHFYFEESG